jgi:hypothetical protein
MFETQINALNKMGFNVVCIINPITQEIQYFLYDNFTPVDALGAQLATFKHRLRGKNITEFLAQRMTALHNQVSQLDENIIRSNVDVLQTITREFSSHFLWINYLNTK